MKDEKKSHEELISELNLLRQEVAGLREAGDRYRTIADNTYDWEFWLNPEGRFLYVSPSCKRISGRDPEEFMKDPGLRSRIIHPDDRPIFERHLAEVEKRTQHGEIEYRVVLPDGTIRWVSHACQPVYGDDGQFLGTRGSNRDITDRKLLEKELREETLFSDSITKVLPGLFCVFAAQGSLVRWNKNMETVTGYSEEELGGIGPLDFIAEEDRAFIAGSIHEAVDKGFASGEAMVLTKGGQKIPYQFVAVPMISRGVTYIVGQGIDITGKKHAEESLLREKQFSEAIINSLPGLFYVFEVQGNFIRWNKNLERISGYSPEEISKMTPLDLFGEEDREVIALKVREVIELGEASVEAEGVTKDGQKVPLYFTGLRLTLDDKIYVIGMGIDISGRRRAEEDLRREKQFSESIVNSLPGVFYVFEAAGAFIRWNRNFERVLGYSAEEIAGTKPVDLFGGEDKELIAARIEEAVVRGSASAEADLVTKGGQKIPYYFTAISMDIKDKTYIVGMGIDISERRQAELALKATGEELEKRVMARTAELSRTTELLQQQQQAFMEVSVPVVTIWERILLVPLIGIFDSKRAQLLMETLLTAIEEKQARVAILDISGIPVMDTLVAKHLFRTASAAGLMGTACIVTGMKPSISQTIVQLGVDLSGIITRATMAEGLQTAIAMTGDKKGI